MSLLIYLIKTVLISGLLLGYYMLFLRNRPFHDFNRYFLLSIPLLGFLLPAFHFNIPAFWNQPNVGSPVRLLGVGMGTLEDAVTIYGYRQHAAILSWQSVSMMLYSSVTAFLLFRLFKTLRFLRRLKKQTESLKLPGATVFFVSEKGTPFSFFKSIFWGKEMDINSPAGKQILRHELFHVTQYHSLDVLVVEILSIIYWFNPFVHIIRQELKAIHEYTADAYAAQVSDNYEYASLLLFNISGPTATITNPFFKNQIKRRITMITRTNKNRKNRFTRLMILPLIAVLAGLFSFKMQNHFFHSSKAIRVVIDAGHGGSFTGSEFSGLLEKDINLTIAKKIQSMSREYNVDVIMSRETDVTPGSNELHESLVYIAALPKNKNADLFISIHVNATEAAPAGKLQTSNSGFQIYIPRKSSEAYENSRKFGSIMTEAIKPDYLIESELKQTQGDGGNIYILKNATVPALLIECGYLDNPADQKYLQDEKNQEKIARDILEGIKNYGLQNNSYSSVAPPGQVESGGTEKLKTDEIPAITETSLTEDSTAPLRKVEVEAEYPGGSGAWGKYLSKTLTYPDAAVGNEIQGNVIVEFVINEDGSLTNIHAISGPKELRAESVRVITESGKWVPAKDHGVIVASYHKQPINYRLSTK
jgi:N-acetylmuramoyl-L-alanine amidase